MVSGNTCNWHPGGHAPGVRGRGKSPLRTEEKHQPLFGGKPIGTWTATEPTQRAGAEGSGSASPPNPVRALVPHQGVGRAGLGRSPVGEICQQPSHTPGRRSLLPNRIPFLPSPASCHRASGLRPVTHCTHQGATLSSEQGTPLVPN